MAEGEGDGLGVAAEHVGAGGGHEVVAGGGVEAGDGEVACCVIGGTFGGLVPALVRCGQCGCVRVEGIEVVCLAGLPEFETVIFPLAVLSSDCHLVKYSRGSIYRSVIPPH